MADEKRILRVDDFLSGEHGGGDTHAPTTPKHQVAAAGIIDLSRKSAPPTAIEYDSQMFGPLPETGSEADA